MTIFTKPTMWCLCLHYVAWVPHEDNEDISYCPYCKREFLYPTKKNHNPVYKKFL